MKANTSLVSIIAAAKNLWKPAVVAGLLAIGPSQGKSQTAIEVNTTQAGSAGATVVGVATSPSHNYMVDTYLTTDLRKPLNNVSDTVYGNADLGNVVAAGSFDAQSHLELGVNNGASTLYLVNNPDGQILNTWGLGNIVLTGTTSKVGNATYLSKPDGAVLKFDFGSTTLTDTGRTIGAGRILADAYTLQGTNTPRFLAVDGYNLFDFAADGSHADYVTSSFVGSFGDAVLNTNENLTPGLAQQIWGAYNAGGFGGIGGFSGFSTASVPEPATYGALAGGAALVAATALRRRKQSAYEPKMTYTQ